MKIEDFFIIKKPENKILSRIVDYYFYLDTTVENMALAKEYVLPFPRITFGYFFNYPFKVTNLSRGESLLSDMIVSRISTDKITVEPTTEKIKIIGAHIQPFGLAYFTNTSIKSLPWLVYINELFAENAILFKEKISLCQSPEQMFNEVENIFLKGFIEKDLSLIESLIKTIDERGGDVLVSELGELFHVSEKTVRNQFYSKVGCSPKTYIRLVKLRKIAHQLKHSTEQLTDIAFDNNYFDQPHFIREIKDITGKSPNKLRKEIPDFRFLQF